MGQRKASEQADGLTTAGSRRGQVIRLGAKDSSTASGLPSGLSDLDGNLFHELSLEFEPKFGALWCIQNHELRPNFTNALIDEIGNVQKLLGRAFQGDSQSSENEMRYLIWASRRGNIFNLGGDLIHFVELLEQRDRAGMESYAQACIDICYSNYIDLGLPICTIALASGDALGGGLESALSSDILIVEKSAQFGFPEILFGLFPGMGAYSFVQRRAGTRVAEEMIFSGRIYRGEQLFEMGLADVLAPDGQGEATLHDYLKRHDRKFAARRALYDVRRSSMSIERDELDQIGERWVDTAMTLGDRDIKKMRRLAKAQLDRLERQEKDLPDSPKKNFSSQSSSPPAGKLGLNPLANDVGMVISASAPKDTPNHTKGNKHNSFKVLNISPSPVGVIPVAANKSVKSKGTVDMSSLNPVNASGSADATDASDNTGKSGSNRGIYDQILEEVAEARAAATLQPGVERLLSEGMAREEYLEFLEQLYHVVWHFCPTMAAAAARCGDDLRELRYAFYHNIEEEKGHEVWVLDDIKALGGCPDEVAGCRPAVPVQAMIGYNYYAAERENPWAALGMVHVLEEISANYGGRVAGAVARRLGINDGQGFRFLGSHGLMDISHVGSFRDLVENVKSRQDVEAIVEASKVNYALFGALFREA